MSDSPSQMRAEALALADTARWRVLNFFQACFLIGWTMLLIPAALALFAITWRTDGSLWMARHIWAPALLKAAGVRLDVRGLEHLEGVTSCVFLSNHQSMIDIAVVFAAIPRGLRFVAKKVLFYVPFLGWYMWAMGMVFVDRTNPKQAIDSLRKAATIFKSGAHVMTFPEGTRSRDGRILPFKKGGVMLAIEAGVPIVPVSIEGARDVLPSDGFAVRPGVIRVAVGEPIPTAGLQAGDRDALIRRVRDAVIELNLSIGGEGGDRSTSVG